MYSKRACPHVRVSIEVTYSTLHRYQWAYEWPGVNPPRLVREGKAVPVAYRVTCDDCRKAHVYTKDTPKRTLPLWAQEAIDRTEEAA